MPANNFFFGTPDPLLSNPGEYNVDDQIKEMQRLQDELAHRQFMLQQSKQHIQQPPQPPKSQSPVWDEIDSIMNALSDKEFDLVSTNAEFVESQNRIMGIIQAMQIRIIRPHVEASKEGKEALDYHLTLVKRLRNAASKEVDEAMSDFKEYTEKYADMPYAEYVKMKRDKKGGKR